MYGSFIALSGNDFQSSIWTLKEIQNTPMKAHMAVLSACQTGLGQVHDAGILGIARGFQISGVPRVIVSLWNVDDNATETMMVKFMTNLKTNYPSDALRLAMLEMREENPDPVYWASFTIFGTLW